MLELAAEILQAGLEDLQGSAVTLRTMGGGVIEVFVKPHGSPPLNFPLSLS